MTRRTGDAMIPENSQNRWDTAYVSPLQDSSEPCKQSDIVIARTAWDWQFSQDQRYHYRRLQERPCHWYPAASGTCNAECKKAGRGSAHNIYVYASFGIGQLGRRRDALKMWLVPSSMRCFLIQECRRQGRIRFPSMRRGVRNLQMNKPDKGKARMSWYTPTMALHSSKTMSKIRSSELETNKNLSKEWVGCLKENMTTIPYRLRRDIQGSVFQALVKQILVSEKWWQAPDVRIVECPLFSQVENRLYERECTPRPEGDIVFWAREGNRWNLQKFNQRS